MSSLSQFLGAAVLVGSCWRLSAQSPLEARLVDEVKSGFAAVSSQQELSAWRTPHNSDRIDLAHLDTSKDSYEVDFARQNQWCATSVAATPAGLTRAATFYVPEVAQGKLPPLPAKQDSALTGSCRLGAVWLEAPGPDLTADVVKQLTADWGVRVQPYRQEPGSLFVAGSGVWNGLSMWRRGNISVWVAWTAWDKGIGLGPRTIAYIERDRPADLDLSTLGSQAATAAALKIAALAPALGADVTPETCFRLDEGIAAARLSRWLGASGNLSSERRAAALVVADSFVSCVQPAGDRPTPFTALGVKFGPGCPQDGPVYANNFREQAGVLDPKGTVGALAALASLQSPCSLKGSGSWPDLVISHGQTMLGQFAPGPWSPWVYLAIARAHDVKLSFSLPPGEPESSMIHPLSAAQSRDERNAAIAGFAQFIAAQPNSAEAVAAWQEAWRLTAGLPPSAIHSGCGCE